MREKTYLVVFSEDDYVVVEAAEVNDFIKYNTVAVVFYEKTAMEIADMLNKKAREMETCSDECVIWKNKLRKWYILRDGYGLGISDGYYVDRPIIYDNLRVSYDNPETLPEYVKFQFERLARDGKITNRMGGK